jgi:hypothetical protein
MTHYFATGDLTTPITLGLAVVGVIFIITTIIVIGRAK